MTTIWRAAWEPLFRDTPDGYGDIRLFTLPVDEPIPIVFSFPWEVTNTWITATPSREITYEQR